MSTMDLAPIVVFAYRRPRLLERVLEGLAANDLAPGSRLIIFCDGPKANATDADRDAVRQVREVARSARGFADVEVVEAPENKGLARSVIDGVTRVVEQYGRVIVVEEDAVVSPHFLRFMNEALDTYAMDEQVFSVGSWSYYVDPSTLGATYLIRYPDSLAWATWERSWRLFEADGAVLHRELRQRGRLQALDADGRVSYFSRMLREQIKGRIDSWAIRWTASCVLHGGSNVFPCAPLALNRGFGAGATHETGADPSATLELAQGPIAVEHLPLIESEEAIVQWARYIRFHFEGGSDPSMKGRIWRSLPRWLKQWYAKQKSAGREGTTGPPGERTS
ncbi:MAG: glycosyltransferase [Flavobacteriales bacterium]|nr:glycosyltransferase [Flavobacteriales bacterium]